MVGLEIQKTAPYINQTETMATACTVRRYTQVEVGHLVRSTSTRSRGRVVTWAKRTWQRLTGQWRTHRHHRRTPSNRSCPVLSHVTSEVALGRYWLTPT